MQSPMILYAQVRRKRSSGRSARHPKPEGSETAARRNVYYSTFVSGLEAPVSEALRGSLDDVEVQEVHAGLVLYSSSAPPGQVKKLRFFRNTFLLLRRLDVMADAGVEDVLRVLTEDPQVFGELRRYGRSLRASFRIMVQESSRLVPVQPGVRIGLEDTVRKATGLRTSRGKADHEFWLHLRTDGTALFSLRVTRHPDLEKVLERGELRPELVDVLCRLSEPRAGELFLDPFSGHGAIPLARAAHFPRGLVLANEIDEQKAARLRVRVARLGLKRLVVVRRVNALEMDRYRSGSIDKIVTDPPWGLFSELDRKLGEFYGRMLTECQRVLKSGGIVVILMPRDATCDALIRSLPGLPLVAEFSILMSGRKATVYKLAKS